MGIAVSVGLHFQHILGAQIVAVMEQVVDARRAIRLFPSVCKIRFVIRPHYTSISGDNQSGFRVECLRELVKRNIAGPFIVVRVSRNGGFAVTLLRTGTRAAITYPILPSTSAYTAFCPGPQTRFMVSRNSFQLRALPSQL